MSKHIIAGCVLFLVFALAGCQVWVKRGAGPDELSRDQSECSARADGNESGEAYAECMQNLGWHHQDKSLKPSDSSVVQSPGSHSSPTQSLEQDRPDVEEKRSSSEDPATKNVSHDAQHAGKYKVGSWWKTGGNPELLKQDQGDCRSEIASTDKSSLMLWDATPAFIQCMKNKGWHGFSE